jgi:hypothetical protein
VCLKTGKDPGRLPQLLHGWVLDVWSTWSTVSCLSPFEAPKLQEVLPCNRLSPVRVLNAAVAIYGAGITAEESRSRAPPVKHEDG